MKYIKIYEEFKPFENLKKDIEGIFVDLKDLRYSVVISNYGRRVDKLDTSFELELTAPSEVDMNGSDRELIIDSIKMYVDYMKHYYKSIVIKYKHYLTRKSSLNNGYNYLEVVNSRTLLLEHNNANRLKNNVYITDKIQILVKLR
jgi:hypothetical protein